MRNLLSAAKLQALSRPRLITTTKCQALTSFNTMLAAEHYTDLFSDVSLPKHELLEIHRSKISLHHAKRGLRLPDDQATAHLLKTCWPIRANLSDYMRRIIGLSHGDIAHRKCFKNPQTLRLDMAKVAGSNPAEPIQARPLFHFREVFGIDLKEEEFLSL